MPVLINGQPSHMIPVNDRGLSYGDGVFETILILNGKAILPDLHLARLNRGLDTLSISLEESLLTNEYLTLIRDSGFPSGVLKIIITRGAGGRGYRSEKLSPTRILSYQAYERPVYPDAGVKVFLCQQRLAEQASLAGLKHLNRLEQVLASQEWPDESFQEGVMQSTSGAVIEGTKSNLFLSIGGQWLTPDLSLCGIDGVLRTHLLNLWQDQVEVRPVTLAELQAAEECFLGNSVAGIMPIQALITGQGTTTYTPGRLCEQAHSRFMDLLP